MNFEFDYSIIKNFPIDFSFPGEIPSPKESAILAAGKSASTMLAAFLRKYPEFKISPKFVALPEKIVFDKNLFANAEIFKSTHPEISEKSFEAGTALVNFVKKESFRKYFITFLSGGSSALIEYGEDKKKIIENNEKLLYSGLPIDIINKERIKNSLIKGGKLTNFAPFSKWITFVMSDIPFENGFYFTGSMPFWREDNSNCILIKTADSSDFHDFLKKYLEKSGFSVAAEKKYLNCSVSEFAEIIEQNKVFLKTGKAVLLTGEPTVKIENMKPGNGGRMSHLALLLVKNFFQHNFSSNIAAISSDGIDGSSQNAGVYIKKSFFRAINPLILEEIEYYLNCYDSASFFEKYGLALKSGYTGLNLNDAVILFN